MSASVHESTFTQLKDMGIDPTLAREAAARYHSVEPAINWCFGDGANWQPDTGVSAPSAGPPSYGQTWSSNGTTVQHREVADPLDSGASSPPDFADSLLASPAPGHVQSKLPPPIPPRSQRHNTPILNPFLSGSPPPNQPISITVDDHDDEDEELRKAIALSQADAQQGEGTSAVIGREGREGPERTERAEGGEGDEEKRAERERSVRASGAPPPSPDANEEGQVMWSLFGPSNKTDDEGKMALVPASQNQSGNNTNLSKEEEDMNRAIQESLMTASFHSASAIKDAEKPLPVVRAEGAPMIFHSQSNQSTYAANLIQAMYAVPQLRDSVFAVLEQESYISNKGRLLGELFTLAKTEPLSFAEVDDTLSTLRDGWERSQLPPNSPTIDFFEIVAREMQALISGGADTPNASAEEVQRRKADTQRLFYTSIEGDRPMESTFVTFQRQPNVPNDIYTHLSNILWPADAPQSTIGAFSDVLTVFIRWDAGAAREVWKLEEQVVLDRFLKSNAAYAMNRRAQQSLNAGNARRLQDRIDHFKFHQGQNYQDSLKTLIHHLDTSPASDGMHLESRKEMRDKLATILEVLEEKVGELEKELEEVQKAAGGSVFETDDPELRQHVYTLRAVLMYDGAVVGQNHLFIYVRGDDGRWWKIQDHEITQVEWESIASDRTGLWMDGGPYTLIYSRESARPRPKCTSPSRTTPEDAENDTRMQEEPKQSEGDEVLVDLSEEKGEDAVRPGVEGGHEGVSRDVDDLMM